MYYYNTRLNNLGVTLPGAHINQVQPTMFAKVFRQPHLFVRPRETLIHIAVFPNSQNQDTRRFSIL